MITCKQNGKSYIGKSIDIERRIYDHFHSKLIDEFHDDIRKLGTNEFEWKVLHVSPTENLVQAEKESIELYGTLWPNGYNLSKGPGTSFKHGVGLSKGIVERRRQQMYAQYSWYQEEAARHLG